MSKVFTFSINDINGNPLNWDRFKGKKLLFVNVASACGLTPQYVGLEAIYKNYKDSGFEIIGFPSNDFAGQEPGTEEEILTFCQTKYDVTFTLTQKINVKGEGIHPLYKYLTDVTREEISWNFQKFLIDENGTVIKSIPPTVSPLDEEIIGWIERK